MWDSVDDILDFAVGQEENAAQFYRDLSGRSNREHIKKLFLDLAGEEENHKAKLLEIKAGKQMLPAEQAIIDLKIGEHVEDVPLSSDLDYKDALIVAMKAEKGAFRLYHDLASATDDPNLKATLLGLAQEEAKHKLRFEIEYDDYILTEN
jgi:rubrerythrin